MAGRVVGRHGLKVLPVRKKGQQGTRRLPKFHESLPQKSWKGIEDDGKRGKGTKKGFSVVKEGQAETGRTLVGRDLVGVTLATEQAAKPGRRNVPNHLALTAGLSIMRRTWLIQQVKSRKAERMFQTPP